MVQTGWFKMSLFDLLWPVGMQISSLDRSV